MCGDPAVVTCRCRVSSSACVHEGMACCAVVLQQFKVEWKEEKKKYLTSCKACMGMQRWQCVGAGQVAVLACMRGQHVVPLSCNSSGQSGKKKKILNWVCYKACGCFLHMLERQVV